MNTVSSWIRRSDGPYECTEAFFRGTAYSPHRHDTYTFAVTTYGVQTFNYRGELRHSTPGKVVVLHPDELHDGQAGTDEGFGYRSVCVAPSDVQDALGGQPLPFIKTGISKSVELADIVNTLLADIDQDERADALSQLGSVLSQISGEPLPKKSMDTYAVQRAKAFIDDRILTGFNLTELEREVNQDRWKLSRDFRALLGTSPYRYLTMRRLDLARHLLLEGGSIADVAHACAFSDQSHFNRHFKKSYGLSPRRWLVSMSRR
ncbi:MAG: AraC family transcriptional regulator [Pseudomonadota bacterium]